MQQQITCLLKSLKPHILLQFIDIHLQDGGSDSGLLSLAYATALCLKKSPGSYMLEQSSLRQHFVQCLESQHFTMFPVKSEQRNGLRIRSKQTITVYCTCRMPKVNGISMICCNNCKKWFHGVCIALIPEEIKGKKWFCPTC